MIIDRIAGSSKAPGISGSSESSENSDSDSLLSLIRSGLEGISMNNGSDGENLARLPGVGEGG